MTFSIWESIYHAIKNKLGMCHKWFSIKEEEKMTSVYYFCTVCTYITYYKIIVINANMYSIDF